jgi:hypothetical protein
MRPPVSRQPKIACIGIYGFAATLENEAYLSVEVRLGFAKITKAVLTDSHFLVPFLVLIAGIVLLIALH